jgi:glucose-1-phosphate cytidylyltransferase
MTAVILAGGLGTRMGGATVFTPKPLLTIGGRPMLWHLVSLLRARGAGRILVATGYRPEAMAAAIAAMGLADVEAIDSGESTQTGGRLRRLADRLAGGQAFLVTYADAVADIDLAGLESCHAAAGRLATVTAVSHRSPFGRLTVREGLVSRFDEKPEDWISAGFFMLEPQVLSWIDGDECRWEEGPLPRLASEGQLAAFRHHGFWACMDTPQDREALEELWASGRAPWKVW